MTAQDYQNIQRMIDATISWHLTDSGERTEQLATMDDLDGVEQRVNELEG